MAAGRLISVLILAAAAFYWVSLPPDRVAFDQSCEPVDLTAALSAAVHGRDFWQRQADAAQAAIVTLLAAPAAAERAAGQSVMNSVEQRMTRLSVPDPDDERQLAQEQRQRLERVGWLRRCHQEISRRHLP